MFSRTGSGSEPDETHYVYKASLAGPAHRFELLDEGLAWSMIGRSGVWPYDTIMAVVLSYRPNAMQPRRFRADLQNTSGKWIKLYSTSWQTSALMMRQDHAYRAFIGELHRRLGPVAALTGGVSRPAYVAGLCIVVLVLAVLVALAVRGLVIGQYAGVLFLIGFGALFTWKVGGFFRRNRPRIYTADRLPDELLP
ncbi:MAG: hypothetical protein EKK40_11955 [Bradyrhizobiaceae bacterium]|nr:MAG: hypothetical protein EKK40_11955 [Bradyrhizobiaceae bacterium]